jgi:hypothetical protein
MKTTFQHNDIMLQLLTKEKRRAMTLSDIVSLPNVIVRCTFPISYGEGLSVSPSTKLSKEVTVHR